MNVLIPPVLRTSSLNKGGILFKNLLPLLRGAVDPAAAGETERI